MRLLLIATACLLPLMAAAQSAPAPAPAAAAAKPSEAARKAALALNDKLHFAGQVNVILDTVRGQIIVGLARGNNKTPEQVQPVVDELLMPDFTAHANDLAAMIVDAWASAFTVDELHALDEFYASPVGTKLLNAMPAVSQDVNKQASGWVQAVVPATLQKHADALHGHGLKIPGEGAAKSGP